MGDAGPATDSGAASAPASVLIVDDQRSNLLALETVLAPLGLRVVSAISGEEALLRLRREEFAVVLLDVMMPGLDGLGTADLLRAQQGGREVPIIFMTAGDIPALDGYAHGAGVVRTGQAEVLAEVPPQVRESWSPTSRAAELVEQLGLRSYMAVPLVVRGRVFGALALTSSSSGRRFGADDLDLATELCRRSGLAIENARLYREAQLANRLKDEFLATVSHELRTPLTAMLAWVHLLRSGQPERASRAVDTIERNAHIQARIVDDLLDVSRIVNGKLSLDVGVVPLASTVQAAVDTLRPLAEAKAIELRVQLAPDAGQLTGDAARLQQVAWNLLSNAIKFTHRGGNVQISLERRESDVQLRVADTGQGIRGDFLPFVFERFRQGDTASTRAHGGLGLGLAIVRHIVELHGGTVAADSPGEGQGAIFTVVLPLRGPVARAQ